jgi:fatty-acyl-CoA synthase
VLEHLVAYTACSMLDAVTVPLHHDAKTWEIERFFEDCDPAVLLASAEFAGRAEDAGTSVPVSILDESGFSRVRGAVRSTERGGKAGDAVLAYTSGTTGQAKAVRITQRNLAHLYPHQCLNHRVPAYGCTTVAMPLSFVAACMDMVQSHLYSGSTVVFHEYFDPDLLWRSMEQWQPNFVWMSTPMISDLAELHHYRPFEAPYLRAFHHGASMLPDNLVRWLFESVGDRLTQGYGMTEYSGGLVTVTGPRDYHLEGPALERRLGTIGRACAGSELVIVGESGERLADGVAGEGEIWLRGPGLSPGYWAREEPLSDADGWFHTGDVAERDEDGFIFLRGRIRDTIQSGGATVYATEVESCIRELSGVADVAAFGVAHPRWGEAVAVAVVRADGATVDEETVLVHGAANLAGFKKPRSVFFIDSLPRTRSGKVQKDELKALLDPS